MQRRGFSQPISTIANKMMNTHQIGPAAQLIHTVFCQASVILLGTLLILTGFACSPFKSDSKPLSSSLAENERSSKQRLNKLNSIKTDSTSPELSRKLRWDGGGVFLGETDSVVFTSREFVATVGELAREHRFKSIHHLVHKYPDVALKSLQEFNPGVDDRTSISLIAESFQKQWCQAQVTSQANWTGYVLLADTQPSIFDAKLQCWQYLGQQQVSKALELNLPKLAAKSSNLAMSAELQRLQAIALMLDDQIEAAINQLQQSIQSSEKLCAYQSQQSQLLLGEFYRHSGQLEKWKSTWQTSVATQSQLLPERGLMDPTFWSRAAFLRPSGIEWPAAVIDNTRNYLVSQELFGADELLNVQNDESLIWLTIGLQHLARLEGQDALLALKKSEAATSNSKIVDQLRLQQARALVLSAQPGAASAILIRLITTNEGQLIADRAKAILGAMKLQNGAISQGVNLIQDSLHSSEHWPRDERLRAQADDALARLVVGREAEALAQLSATLQEFIADGDVDQAYQCLWNKAKYFEKTDQPKLLQQSLAELQDFEKLDSESVSMR